MPTTVQVTVYEFSELSNHAKKVALDQFRELSCIDNADIRESFEFRLEALGYPFEDIAFSLSSSQGDGVAFYGEFNPTKVLERVGFDLKSLPDKLKDTTWKINRNDYARHYSHSRTMNLEVLDSEDGDSSWIAPLEAAVEEDIIKVSDELEELGYKMIEESTSDEAVEDFIVANEYKFLLNGQLFNL